MKLFFIRSVAHSNNRKGCSESVINSQILVLDHYYDLMKEILKKSGKIEKSTIEPFFITLVKIDHSTNSNSIEFLKNHYIDKLKNLTNRE